MPLSHLKAVRRLTGAVDVPHAEVHLLQVPHLQRRSKIASGRLVARQRCKHQNIMIGKHHVVVVDSSHTLW